MTETTSSQAARKGKRPGKGLSVQRIYTTPGVHPYDEVGWERRDVVMTNWRDGSVNFEQRGVEFPDFWSVNATNIVTTKYFRGAVGTSQREWSLKQLVDRVTTVYTRTGRENGYFATDQDAEIFDHELEWALIHQVFSFNSPVWFNVGTASPQQVSACQPFDALVSTPAGLIPIGELVAGNAVGTKVYDAHGVTKIVATKANGVKPVLRLHTKAGYALDVTADHLVWQASDEESGSFTEAGSLGPGDRLLRVDYEADEVKCVEIDRIEQIGDMEVYDIQTESGEYLSGNLRVHNCFILAVDDTMDSILDWYREEGLIFKGGSGAGVNLSRIRSSKELLTSGGTASGPVSFMRGADASAGTIKSGGATRRAAKMVVLDVDHPDVEEFIQTKAREEDKIRVLRDAGFDMDLGGQDIVSVQYQNANNSVRVSDEFMRAVQDDGAFDLRARLTGETIETVKAKGLFRKIAQAAWECADPGIQYDDTINDWHTNPESGRITASNPCFPADQRVVTDKGLIRIGDLVQRAANEEQFAVYTNDVTAESDPHDRVIATVPSRYLITGRNEIIELRFSDGSRIRCTPGHRIWTANRGWVHAEELTEDDKVVRSLQYAPRSMASRYFPGQALAAALAGRSQKLLELPGKWSPEFAHYLGWLVGDGCIQAGKPIPVTVYGSREDQESVLPRHHDLLSKITRFESKPSVQSNGTLQLRVTRAAFGRFLHALGVAEGRAADKVVPDAVFEAPEDAVVAFLQGLFDADGCVVSQESNGTRYVGLGSRSEELLIGVQELLASFGIASRIYQTSKEKTASFHYTRKDGSEAHYGSDGPSYDLRITAEGIREFQRHIGFSLPSKQAKLDQIVAEKEVYKVSRTVTVVSRKDLGYQVTYNLTEPRNHSYIVGGTVVANCSEYLSLDNSSCNLASINLLKFLRADDTFDIEKFAQVSELIITAMDISITFADFPTDKIGTVTRDYRQLGIGYANLGALLMASGHAYDSEGGRAIAGAITSLMTASAYKRSAELAGVVGPYAGYEKNAAAHQRVIRKHAAASDQVRPVGAIERSILNLANKTWQECVKLGGTNGYRNAQSSLLAPTGTIGFMMDCDTTGIEPDLALVKFKKLVGGGSMQIVNQTVPRALRNLGYQGEQIEAITEYIAEHGHVVNAPGLRPEHYEVFDCAMGERSISPLGHVRMMASVQPFLSGSISKTVNMPESATVEEVEQIYFEGWKLGLKALAIYRDNCKVGQPLSIAKKEPKAEAAPVQGTVVLAAPHEQRPVRKRLPKQRSAMVTRFDVAGAKGYITASSYPDDGVGEIFLKLGKQGSTLAGVMDAFSIAISVGLQYGIPLEAYVAKFTNLRFEPAGMTDDPDIRIATSVMDYIFRRLALDHLPYDQRAELGILSASERAAELSGQDPAALSEEVDPVELRQSAGVEAPHPARPVAPAAPAAPVQVPSSPANGVRANGGPHSTAELIEFQQGRTADAPLCLTCGTKMRPAGSCYVCEGCGSTSGCS